MSSKCVSVTQCICSTAAKEGNCATGAAMALLLAGRFIIAAKRYLRTMGAVEAHITSGCTRSALSTKFTCERGPVGYKVPSCHFEPPPLWPLVVTDCNISVTLLISVLAHTFAALPPSWAHWVWVLDQAGVALGAFQSSVWTHACMIIMHATS